MELAVNDRRDQACVPPFALPSIPELRRQIMNARVYFHTPSHPNWEDMLEEHIQLSRSVLHHLMFTKTKDPVQIFEAIVDNDDRGILSVRTFLFLINTDNEDVQATQQRIVKAPALCRLIRMGAVAEFAARGEK